MPGSPGSTSSADYPTTADARRLDLSTAAPTTFISEFNPTGSALLYSHAPRRFAVGQRPRHRPSTRLATSTSRATPSRWTIPATVGAFDTVLTGDLSIFWGDAFVTKIDVSATTNAPVAPPATPGTPTLLAPSNADTPPQPITFDWSDVTSAVSYTIQIDDSSAFTAPLVREASRDRLDLRDQWSGDDDALLARARRELRAGVAGSVVGRPQLHAAAGAAAGGPWLDRHQSVDRRGRDRLDRHGRPERRAPRTAAR